MSQMCADMSTGSALPLLANGRRLAHPGEGREGTGGRAMGSCSRECGDVVSVSSTPAHGSLVDSLRRGSRLPQRSGDPSRDAKGCGGARGRFGGAKRTHGWGANRYDSYHIERHQSSHPAGRCRARISATNPPAHARAREQPDTAASGCLSGFQAHNRPSERRHAALPRRRRVGYPVTNGERA
jgi:hypothetical protein